MAYQLLVRGNKGITDHELGGSVLSAPSALSVDHGQGVLGQDYPLGFVPGALDYYQRIADLSGLGDDAMAVNGITYFTADHFTAPSLPSFSSSSIIRQTRS